MTGIIRNQAANIEYAMTQFPVVVVIGARQTGKTTLVRQVRSHFAYFDLENPRDYERISADPHFFFEQYPDHVILDEAEKYPECFDVLRGVIDRHRSKVGRFLITGSSSPILLKKVSESLAGRVAIIELDTLKGNEWCKRPLSPLYQQIGAHRIKELDLQNYEPLNKEKLQRLWLQGGYPEPLIKGDPFHADWMRYYHDTYLNRDIAALFPRLNHIAYRRFIRLLGNLSGSIINKAEIARGIEVSEKTVNDYFDIAEGTLLWRRIPSFDLNRSKSIIKMPKGHYRDSGLLNHLLKITTGDELYTHPQLGRLFEAWVTEEIIKGLRAARLNQFDIYYYRTRGGAELDLILHGPKGLIPIEIKHGSTVKKQQLISLEAFVHENDCAFGLLVNQGSSVEWIRPKILQCPIGWI